MKLRAAAISLTDIPEYLRRLFASSTTKPSIHSGAERPDTFFITFDRYFGERLSLSA